MGHIDYLTKAAQLGTKLIVGLNSDQSVKLIKGPNRPIQNERARASILAALECVNAVVVFDQETPYDLIRQISPKVLIKGGDYEINEIVGADLVKHQGGRVLTIPFLEGYSTSTIIDKIKHG